MRTIRIFGWYFYVVYDRHDDWVWFAFSRVSGQNGAAILIFLGWWTFTFDKHWEYDASRKLDIYIFPPRKLM